MKTSQKLLLCAASQLELGGIDSFRENEQALTPGEPYSLSDRVDVVILGVGHFQSIYHITKALSTGRYNFVLCAGIAGAYNRAVDLGTVYVAESFQFADCTMEDKYGNKTSIVGSQFLDGDVYPFHKNKIVSPVARELAEMLDLETAGINTLNRTSSQSWQVSEMQEFYPADLETMESAGIAYACAMEHVPYAEIRSVSNHTIPKKEGKWDIPLAVREIGIVLDKILDDNCKLLSKFLE